MRCPRQRRIWKTLRQTGGLIGQSCCEGSTFERCVELIGLAAWQVSLFRGRRRTNRSGKTRAALLPFQRSGYSVNLLMAWPRMGSGFLSNGSFKELFTRRLASKKCLRFIYFSPSLFYICKLESLTFCIPAFQAALKSFTSSFKCQCCCLQEPPDK